MVVVPDGEDGEGGGASYISSRVVAALPGCFCGLCLKRRRIRAVLWYLQAQSSFSITLMWL